MLHSAFGSFCVISCCLAITWQTVLLLRGPVIRAVVHQPWVRWCSTNSKSCCDSGTVEEAASSCLSFSHLPHNFEVQLLYRTTLYLLSPCFYSRTVLYSTWISYMQKALLTQERENIRVKLFSKTRSSRVRCLCPFHWKYFSRNRWCRWLMQRFYFYF